MTDTFKKSLVEILRVAVIGTLPTIIASLEAGSVDWRLVLLTLVIATLRGVDKYIHLEGVAKEEKTGEDSALTKGLVRF